MEIRVPCTNCGKVLLVKDDTAARIGICPNCHHKVTIPRPGANDTPSRSADTPPTGGVIRKAKSTAPVAPPASGSTSSGITSTGIRDTISTARSDSIPGAGRSAADTATTVDEDEEAPTSAATLAGSPSALDPLNEVPDAVWFVRSPGGGQYGPASNEVMRTWISEGRVGTQSLVWRAGWADWLTADRVFDSMLDSPQGRKTTGSTTSKTAAYLQKKQRRRSILPTVWILVGLALVALTAYLIIIF